MTAHGAPPRKAIDSLTQIATLRIELKHSEPRIWRVVEVPTSITLKVLHDIVHCAMGWFDCHLWELVIDGQTYGLPMDENWAAPPPKIATRIRLRDVIQPGITRTDYTYDFGDNWEHSVIVSDVCPGDRGAGYPRFIAGERDGPPEDCGGLPGFYEMLEPRAEPTHPDYNEISEWLDGYDPDEFDDFPIKVALGRIAARRNAAAKRIIKANR